MNKGSFGQTECIETQRSISVLLADDHPPFRIGMRTLLEQNTDIRIVGEADTGAQTLQQLEQLQPDVLVLDCQLPDLDGPTVVHEIRRRQWRTPILALSAFDDISYIRGMLVAGVLGYVLKNEAPGVIVAAVEATARGKSYFSASVSQHLAQLAHAPDGTKGAPTEREQQVLKLLAEGLTNAAIAQQLNIAERTVAYHVENLMMKLASGNRTETVVAAIRAGWLRV
ncbi:MAG TPA: response regulator transcription factor [Chloroflexi bacterium]|jgi:DNA-binding NarL/FixJ family response regulator|nr:response regulator transcription factor [Caldilinea sp.]GIK75285.1 MAG: DNA-binding response regulator [Chloroflexota bacterium]HHW86484.1 response regulator transcription factor [Chloroflexota bacterium]